MSGWPASSMDQMPPAQPSLQRQNPAYSTGEPGLIAIRLSWYSACYGPTAPMSAPECVIRASYSNRTVRVYQAYRPEIALAALQAGRYVPPFSKGRMTWIKPSFNWMMYRSGYATKPGQEMVLGVDITREGFEWALNNAVLSRFSQSIYGS